MAKTICANTLCLVEKCGLVVGRKIVASAGS